MNIQVRHVYKNFGSFQALNDVSLDFFPGELTALLGPSGCGKTTLLRIIAGLETADSGEVVLAGAQAADQPVRERQVGFVFQHYALFRHMSVFENVAFGLRMKARRQRPDKATIKRRVMELLELVQLDYLADRFPDQLSGGQRQRIALARALAVEPRVLLLDEPFGALDARVRKELRRWLRQIHADLRITTILVTHDQEEAMEVADRVVLMNRGAVEQVGSPEDVYEQPATPFVYGFLGSVNLFHGRLEKNRVLIGNNALFAADSELGDGMEVIGFARPHDLQISLKTDAGHGIPAIITRIQYLGISCRLELAAIEPGDTTNFDVEIARTDPILSDLQMGQEVRLAPSRLKLYPQTGINVFPQTRNHGDEFSATSNNSGNRPLQL